MHSGRSIGKEKEQIRPWPPSSLAKDFGHPPMKKSTRDTGKHYCPPPSWMSGSATRCAPLVECLNLPLCMQEWIYAYLCLYMAQIMHCPELLRYI